MQFSFLAMSSLFKLIIIVINTIINLFSVTIAQFYDRYTKKCPYLFRRKPQLIATSFQLAPGLPKPDNFIQWISHYPECKIYFALNIDIGFSNTPFLRCAWSMHVHSYANKYVSLCTDRDCWIVTYPADNFKRPLNNFRTCWSVL